MIDIINWNDLEKLVNFAQIVYRKKYLIVTLILQALDIHTI